MRRQHAQARARVAADDAFAAELLPPRFRLPVVHDEVGVAQVAGRAEAQRASLHPAVERDRGVAERAERDRNRNTADDVVDDLVPDQDLERVGAATAGERERDHRFLRPQEPHFGHAEEARTLERRDAILAGTSRLELPQRHGVPGEVRLPAGGQLLQLGRRKRRILRCLGARVRAGAVCSTAGENQCDCDKERGERLLHRS
jgi:hypothetical protein